MTYWQMQLHEADHRGFSIEDIKEILKTNLIGCTGEPVSLFQQVNKGDIVLIRHGGTLIALVRVVGAIRETREEEYSEYVWFQYCTEVQVIGYLDDIKVSGEGWFIPTTLQRANGHIASRLINQQLNLLTLNQITELLLYKKQIILEGPPGTGKTRLAKAIAKTLTTPKALTEKDIRSNIRIGQVIKSATGYTEYTIQEIGPINITVGLKTSEKNYKPSFNEIINAYHTKKWNGKQENGNDPYACAIAKYIFDNQVSKQTMILQFHPSYSYEDFIRGIVARPNPDGDGILYEAENKIFARFAKDALENYMLSKDDQLVTIENVVAKTNFERFVDHIQEQIDLSEEHKYALTDKVYIFDVDTEKKRFKYKGDKWVAHAKGLNMNFSEVEKIIQMGKIDRSHIVNSPDLASLTKSHATWFASVLEKYNEFIATNKIEITKDDKGNSTLPQNYVIIIDEINRANLSSVLGELIYALEYRGEGLESMYEVDGSNKVILPPNLYIIGTMNTADRSVGHIDYAIRRRFAFVDVIPKDLSSELGKDFQQELFNRVSSLFNHNTHLSNEFAPKEVQLGHSYFIQQYKKDDAGKDITDQPIDFKLRLDYEIKPILQEYVKDGILINKNGKNVEDLINSLTV